MTKRVRSPSSAAGDSAPVAKRVAPPSDGDDDDAVVTHPQERQQVGEDKPAATAQRGDDAAVHGDAAEAEEAAHEADGTQEDAAVDHGAVESTPEAAAIEHSAGDDTVEMVNRLEDDDADSQEPNEASEVATAGFLVVAPPFQVVHESWEAFEEALKAYAQTTYQLYVIRSTTSVKRRNLKITETAAGTGASPVISGRAGDELGGAADGEAEAAEPSVERALIPERYQWYSKSLKCTHGWKDRHRGTGKRGSGVVRSTSCPAKMCVTLQHRGTGPDDWQVVVTKHERAHNHQLSKELYLYYTENRRIYDPDLLAVVGEPSAGLDSDTIDLTNDGEVGSLTSLINQASQRTGLFRVLPSKNQRQASTMSFLTPSSAAVSGTGKQLVALSDASSGNFVIRPRSIAGTPLATMPPPGAMVLTAGTIPSTAMEGGIFRVPRVAVKAHASWEAFHTYVSQYSFDTAQIFRTRSTVSVGSRNAKMLAAAAARTGEENHEVASYASYASASPTTRLIPEEYKWYSKLLICTYGWKRKSRSKGSRFVDDHGEPDNGEPCPAMLLARMERNVDGEWRVAINRQVQEHNHRLSGHVDESSAGNSHESLTSAAGSSTPTEDTAPMPSAATEASSRVDNSTPDESHEVVAGPVAVVAPSASTDQREIVVRVPKLQSIFASWDDFHANLKSYSDATYQLYRTRTTSSAKGRNQKIAEMKRGGEGGEDGNDPEATSTSNAVAEARMIPESWRWYSKTLTCTHGWKERHRGAGKRAAHVVRSTKCPVKICATVQYVAPSSVVRGANTTISSPTEDNNASSTSCWRVVVTKHVVDHNHNLSRELYQHYCENRRIYDPELLAIDASNAATVLRQRVYPGLPGSGTTAAGTPEQSGQLDGGLVTSRPLTLSTQIEAGLAEAVSRAQLFESSGNAHPIVLGAGTGDTDSGSLGLAQQAVPSVVLLPYSGAASYMQGGAQSQPEQQQRQHEALIQAAAFAGRTAGAHAGQEAAGGAVATLAAMAAPGLTAGNILVLNHAAMATAGTLPQAGTNVISISCRVHGSSASTGSTLAGSGQVPGMASGTGDADGAHTPQCTCFRIAGGGNYVTIVPADAPRPNDTSFDADDESLMYSEDMEGVWQPSSVVEIEHETTEAGEEIWRVPRIIRRFPTWEIFHQYLDAYSTATFQLYRVRTTYSVRARNVRLRQLAASRGLIVRNGEDDSAAVAAVVEQEGVHGLSRAHLVPEHFEWYSKTFLCTHGWKRRSRGNGQRVSHNLRATECPAKVCATLQRTDGVARWSVVVTKHVPEHNHEVSEAVFQQYCENRRVRDPKVLAQAEQLWRSGGTRRRVFDFLKDQAPDRVILMKDVHNLVARWQAQERRQPPGPHRQQRRQVMASSYFQGGDFVELLSAQGKAPAAAWKLQGKIAKSFDKGIKGNAFQLNGGSETKMQLPKATSSSSLGLAQRFLVLQLLVPFTRSFSVEIGFADFQKVRRRFVVASAFRETTRTALHVQLPLNGADVPRDQWLSLVFDLQALSEAYFPDSGFRSMESLCVSGSCRVKRIFTMKDAPTPSPPSQGVRHADMREFPRQFAFSAAQRGTGRSGSAPIPTIYFVMTPTEDVTASSKDLAVTGTASNGVRKPVRRGQTAPSKTQSKPHPVVKGARATRPMSGPPEPKIQAPSSPVARSSSCKEEDKAIVSGQQRLRTPTPVSAPYSATGRLSAKSLKSPRFDELSSRSPMPTSPVETVTSIHDDRAEVRGHNRSRRSGTLSSDERHAEPSDQADELETGEEEEPTDAKLLLSPVETVDRPLDDEQEPTEPVHHRSSSEKAGSAHSSVTKLSEPARRTIVGEIQRKLAMMEDDDERAIQRDQELFLRHTSLRSGEWHLRQLQDDELDPEATAISEDESDSVQLGASWRRELRETREGRLSPSPREKQRLSHEIEAVASPRTSKWLPDAEKKRKSTIFSFPRSIDSEAAAVHRSIDQERSARLFDFDSLLQDIGPLSRPPDTVEVRASTSNEGISAVSNPQDMGNGVADDGANSDGEDAELTTLLAAKRSARRHQPHIQEQHQEEERPPLFHRSLLRGEESKDKVVEKEEASDAGMDVSDDKPVKRSRFVVHAHQIPDEAAVAQEGRRTTDAKEQHEQPGDGDAEDEEDEEDALSMDLTSDLDELSSSEEEEAERDRQVRLASQDPGKRELEGDEEDDKSFDFGSSPSS
ncbi:hypothetical protein BBJ28_00003055 [Nothophytophthora sp. Chile5]|nr:hypothetical protein BBJ28_00003055 [Nothophytophthora sp. Chile5]